MEVINAQLLAIFASLVHISAFLIYNKDIFKERCSPSPISWFIWAFMTVVNFTSYKAMNGNWIVAILPTVGSIMCISTFLFLVFGYLKSKEKIKKPDWKDVTLLAICIIAIGVWLIFKSATKANLIIQLCLALSFIPTIRSVWKDPQNEKPLPWFTWTCAFLMGLGVLLLKWGGNYFSLIFPIGSATFHFSVGILALRKKKV